MAAHDRRAIARRSSGKRATASRSSASRSRQRWRRYVDVAAPPWRKGWVSAGSDLPQAGAQAACRADFLNALHSRVAGLFDGRVGVVRAPFEAARPAAAPTSTGRPHTGLAVRWRHAILGWARAGGRGAPVADVYHGHDLTGLLAAARAAASSTAGRSSTTATRSSSSRARTRDPAALGRAIFGGSRGRWIRRCRGARDGELSRWSRARAALPAAADASSLHNTPVTLDPARHPRPRPDPPRDWASGPADADRALPRRLLAPTAGSRSSPRRSCGPAWSASTPSSSATAAKRDWLLAQAADPRYGGRLHVLPAVPPDELLAWVVDADVGVCADPGVDPEPPAVDAEQAVRVPGRGRAGRRERLPRDAPDRARGPVGPLGELCRPDDPADVAPRRSGAILAMPAGEREATAASVPAGRARDAGTGRPSRSALLELYAT